MTVEMGQGFVWPTGPRTEEDFKSWNKKELKIAKEENAAMQERAGPGGDAVGVGEERRAAMKEQAKALLEGRERWRSGGKEGQGIMFGR